PDGVDPPALHRGDGRLVDRPVGEAAVVRAAALERRPVDAAELHGAAAAVDELPALHPDRRGGRRRAGARTRRRRGDRGQSRGDREQSPDAHGRTMFRPGPPLSLSTPGPPSRVSLPSSPKSLSLPAPPEMVSLPAPPQIVSLPPRPVIVSLPPRPAITSAPAVPRSASGPAVPAIVARSPAQRALAPVGDPVESLAQIADTAKIRVALTSAT